MGMRGGEKEGVPTEGASIRQFVFCVGKKYENPVPRPYLQFFVKAFAETSDHPRVVFVRHNKADMLRLENSENEGERREGRANAVSGEEQQIRIENGKHKWRITPTNQTSSEIFICRRCA